MKQILTIQGYKLIVITLSFILVSGVNVSGQQVDKQEKGEDLPIEKVFEYLEVHYEVFFNYKNADLEDVEVNFQIDPKETIEEATNRLANQTDLEFELTNNQFIIVSANENFDDKYSEDQIESYTKKTFRGILKDEETKKPIEYANIFYKQKQHIGTISEQNGEFILRNIEDSQNDTLVFSLLGYKRKYLPISEIDTNFLEISLTLQAYELDEIAIVDQSYLKQLLIKVVENIPKNYPNQKHRLTGYFQEESMTQGEYSHFLEAYLTVENHGYQEDTKLIKSEYSDSMYPRGENKVKYHQIRRSNDLRYLPKRLETWLGGSIHQLMRKNYLFEKGITTHGNHTLSDALNNIKNLTMKKTATKSKDRRKPKDEGYTFMRYSDCRLLSLGTQIRGTDTLITVGIKSALMIYKGNDELNPIHFDITKFLINKSNYAVEKITKAPTEELKQLWPEDSIKNHDYEEIQYRNINGKYYPVLFINKMSLNYNLETRYEISTTRFLVQEVQTSKDNFLKIKPSKKLKRDERLVDKKYKYDPEFWKTYKAPKRMKASLALKLDLEKNQSLEEQFEANQKKNK